MQPVQPCQSRAFGSLHRSEPHVEGTSVLVGEDNRDSIEDTLTLMAGDWGGQSLGERRLAEDQLLEFETACRQSKWTEMLVGQGR